MNGYAMRPLRRPAALAVAAILVFALGACRAASVETDPSPVYMIDVVNQLSEPMVVQFNDGLGSRLLGTVSARGSERFVIASPRQLDVTIIAVDREGRRQVRRSVTLQLGTAIPVVIS